MANKPHLALPCHHWSIYFASVHMFFLFQTNPTSHHWSTLSSILPVFTCFFLSSPISAVGGNLLWSQRDFSRRRDPLPLPGLRHSPRHGRLGGRHNGLQAPLHPAGTGQEGREVHRQPHPLHQPQHHLRLQHNRHHRHPAGLGAGLPKVPGAAVPARDPDERFPLLPLAHKPSGNRAPCTKAENLDGRNTVAKSGVASLLEHERQEGEHCGSGQRRYNDSKHRHHYRRLKIIRRGSAVVEKIFWTLVSRCHHYRRLKRPCKGLHQTPRVVHIS